MTRAEHVTQHWQPSTKEISCRCCYTKSYKMHQTG